MGDSAATARIVRPASLGRPNTRRHAGSEFRGASNPVLFIGPLSHSGRGLNKTVQWVVGLVESCLAVTTQPLHEVWQLQPSVHPGLVWVCENALMGKSVISTPG